VQGRPRDLKNPPNRGSGSDLGLDDSCFGLLKPWSHINRGVSSFFAASLVKGRRKLFVLSRASYLLLVLLSGPFALHVLANHASQNKTLAGTLSEEVNLAPPPIQGPDGSVQQSPPRQQQSPSATLSLPLNFQRHTGDLDGMVKRHEIRALVVYSRSGFFYDAGQPEGIYYEALNEFQRFVNQRFRTGALKINVTYIPVRPEQLEQALLQGVGDVIAFGVIVTPQREKEVLFTIPIDSHVKQILVTGPKSPAITSLEDLAGKEVYVNPLSAYYQNLQHLSQSFQKTGKPPILLKSADPDLTDEDLLEMVNASLLPATVTINIRAEFWAKILPHLTLHPNIVLKDEEQLAWATRKDSPQLRQLLNEFVKGREVGTLFGNIMVKRYLENTHWVKDATSPEELKKFQAYVRYFQKYGAEYDFDYLMLVAQGYEESGLDQSLRNPSGAVGIMQVMPQYAAAPPISIPNVEIAEGNIHAGAKMMRNIADSYFNDPALDPLNKILMTFASYNAGPNRIADLRKRAESEGLDANRWFGNVELIVARDVGEQTVQYVSNIYKYYVAYKLTLQESAPIK
jgi:membrane-bound lytic murein transglycosylase MltF